MRHSAHRPNPTDSLRLLLLLVALVGGPAFSLYGQNVVGDFECQSNTGAVGFPMPDCNGWSDESLLIGGLNTVGDATAGCTGMPTLGNQFLSCAYYPTFSGPTTPLVPSGNTQPAWPFTGGSVTILTKTATATSDTLIVDYVLLRSAFAANYFFQILVVDPVTDQVIAPLVVTETTPQTYSPAVCVAPNGGFPGGPILDATQVQFATTTLPSAWVGQGVKFVITLGQTDGGSSPGQPGQGQFIEAAALVDNLRFAPPPPVADALLLTASPLVFGNPAGPGTVSATGTVIGFVDTQGNVVTDPSQDSVIGASFTLSGNLASSGPDLAGGLIAATTVDLIASPGADELSFVGQYLHDAARDRSVLGGTPAVLPSVRRPLASTVITTPTRTGAGSSILDGLEQSLGTAGDELTLLFDIVPGQAPRLERLVLNYQPAPSLPDFNFDTDGAGAIVLGVAGVAPTDELFNVFVVNPTVSVGGGSFYGLEFTPLVADIISAPLGTIPFHVSPSAEGAFFWGLPPGSLPAGLTLDGAAGTVDPLTGFPTWVSPVVRRVF